jgi:hypothetical protein
MQNGTAKSPKASARRKSRLLDRPGLLFWGRFLAIFLPLSSRLPVLPHAGPSGYIFSFMPIHRAGLSGDIFSFMPIHRAGLSGDIFSFMPIPHAGLSGDIFSPFPFIMPDFWAHLFHSSGRPIPRGKPGAADRPSNSFPAMNVLRDTAKHCASSHNPSVSFADRSQLEGERSEPGGAAKFILRPETPARRSRGWGEKLKGGL